jgi:hypothetical protein
MFLWISAIIPATPPYWLAFLATGLLSDLPGCCLEIRCQTINLLRRMRSLVSLDRNGCRTSSASTTSKFPLTERVRGSSDRIVGASTQRLNKLLCSFERLSFLVQGFREDSISTMRPQFCPSEHISCGDKVPTSKRAKRLSPARSAATTPPQMFMCGSIGYVFFRKR